MVVIEQSDRDAAADLLGGAAPDGLRDGRQDTLSLVLALATHRLAERERCAKAAEYIAYGEIQHDAETASHDHACEKIANAIRSGKEPA